MSFNKTEYQRVYMSKYFNTYYGKYSIKISNIKRSAKFKNNTPESKLTLTTDEFIDILSKFNYKCAYCGCDEELIPSMIDRFSKGGSLDRFNTVPACKYCNSMKLRKRTLTFNQWYKEYKYFSQDRYETILNHITKG